MMNDKTLQEEEERVRQVIIFQTGGGAYGISEESHRTLEGLNLVELNTVLFLVLQARDKERRDLGSIFHKVEP